MQKIGGVFCDAAGRTTLGVLSHDAIRDHAMLGLYIEPMLAACRVALESGVNKVRGCCIPYESVKDPPYIAGDLQLGQKRTKIGWVYTESDQRGPAYQVILERDVLLKLFSFMWVHIHNM